METPDIDAVTRGLNPSPDTHISEAAWTELSAGITETVGEPIARSAAKAPGRLRLALVAASLLLIGGVVAATVIDHPGQDRPEALSVTARGDHLIIRVVDPTADPKRYNAELKKLGLHITVKAVAVSKPFVGTMVSYSGRDEHDTDQLRRLEPGELCNGTLNASDPGCQDGLEVPVNYDGETEIQFGRAAKPGEQYWHFSSNVDDPGEAMHGAKWRDRTIAEVKQVLAERELKVLEYYDANQPRDAKAIPTPPDDWYVRDASEYVAGEITLYVAPTR
ncbi:hypothetical protein F1D05_18075 [Kribbella qitaiheensis]|uniref:Uncharacterized protein n=1 Tax=Kribbella qitaiheensis TaxID=1544730 RepID=A0A7G6WZQ7_9ACTN|nr:hypothetical protein [Kribbella qitaiheensis]QNE19472.1 hypothetical protein F1D05_18075 [Kribbella qitaiheensis]